MPKFVNSLESIVHRLRKTVNCQLPALSKVEGSTVNCQRGFSLVEILIVISVASLLGLLGFSSLRGTQAEARDTQRKVDLESIKTALELYYQQNNNYPNTTGAAEQYSSDDSPGPWIITLSQSFIKILPKDPKQNTSGSNPTDCNSSLPYTYCYKVAAGSQSFELWANLERTDDPEISSNPTAKCTLTPPNANFNYCLKSN